jgi:hypothetical protein
VAILRASPTACFQVSVVTLPPAGWVSHGASGRVFSQ